MTDTELKLQIEAEQRAMKSLVAFREKFIPAKDDVPPAAFHEEWSDILLNGTGSVITPAIAVAAATEGLDK